MNTAKMAVTAPELLLFLMFLTMWLAQNGPAGRGAQRKDPTDRPMSEAGSALQVYGCITCCNV